MSRPFSVRTYFECPTSGDAGDRFPPHKLIIEPLLSVAQEIRVFQKRGYEYQVPIPPHTRQKDTLVLDLSAELVRGWEKFWNSGSWKRGAVAIKCDTTRIDWGELFFWTQYGGGGSSVHQLRKGTPAAAITYCDKQAVGECAVFCFSAANGIEWVDVWSDESRSEELDRLARAECRYFVRSCEQGKFPREIILNHETYRSNI